MMTKTKRKLTALLAAALVWLAPSYAQTYAEFVPDRSTDYAIKSAEDGKFMTYKGLGAAVAFEVQGANPIEQAFRFVPAEGDGNLESTEYYIVPSTFRYEGVDISKVEYLNEKGESKASNNPTTHTVRLFRNSDNTFAIKAVGSFAVANKKRSTYYVDTNGNFRCREKRPNFEAEPPTEDYIFSIEPVTVPYNPTVENVSIKGIGALGYGKTTQYTAEVVGNEHPSQTVAWTLIGKKSPSTTLSSTGVLTVAQDETAEVLKIKATSQQDGSKAGEKHIILITPPATAAPTPVHDPEQVIGIFSDHYSYKQFNPDYSDWLPEGSKLARKEIITPWDSAPNEHVLFVDSLNSGVTQIALGAVSLVDKDSIHIDIYSPGSNKGIGEFDFSFYMGKSDWTGSPGWIEAGIWHKITSQQQHDQWISLEVPVKQFTDKGPFALVLRLRRGSNGAKGLQLYVDNVYAYASKHIDHTPKVTGVSISGSTATQRGKTVQYKATVSGTDNPATTVAWKLEGYKNEGTTLSEGGLLNVAADEAADTLYVTATSTYDTSKSAKVMVTLIDPPTIVADASVDLTAAIPHCPPPAPRHHPDSVRALFSDVYTYDPNKFGLTFDDWLGAGKTKCERELIQPFVESPAESILKLEPMLKDNQVQISLGTFNFIGMDSIHMDIYSPGGDQGIGEFDYGLIFNWSGGNHVAANIWLNITNEEMHGRWISIDLPLSQFRAYNANFDFKNVNILRLRRGGNGSQGKLLYVDNIYAYRGGGGGVGGLTPPVPPELPAPPTVPVIEGVDKDNVKAIFCEQFEEEGYKESGHYMTDISSNGEIMYYGQNKEQQREFVNILPDNETIKLTSWNDYPFMIHESRTSMDLSDMEYLHVSAYLASATVGEQKANLTFWMHDSKGGKVDNASAVTYVPMESGKWVSISIPLCYYREKLDLSNAYVLRVRLGGYSAMNVYIDNIFAYKGKPIGSVGLDCSEQSIKCDPIYDKEDDYLPPFDRPYLGVNLASASGGTVPGIMGQNYRMPKMEDLWYFKAKGVRLIRLPFRWKRIQDELGGPIDKDGDIAAMKEVVREAKRLGMWVMLDMHDYAEYSISHQGEKTPDGKEVPDTLFQLDGRYKTWISPTNHDYGPWKVADEPHERDLREYFADVWVKLAKEFRGYNNIWGYDLQNEPKGVDLEGLRECYQLVIDEIRKVDKKTAIVIEGKNYTGAAGWPNNAAGLENLVDPSNKIIYQAHCYFDDDTSGTYNESYDTEMKKDGFFGYKKRLDPFINWLKEKGKRGMLGEFGVPYNGAKQSDPRYMVLIDSVFSYLKENQLTATYWCGGAFYETNHLSVSPDKDYCTEKSTMAVMEKYIDNFHEGWEDPNAVKYVKVDNYAVSAYPNPVVNTLTILAKSDIISVRIYNIFGQMLHKESPNAVQGDIDFSRYTNGNYILQVEQANGTTSALRITKK